MKKNSVINTTYWDERNQHIHSHVGKWRGGIDVNCEGYSLINDLMGNVSLTQLNILNATGKLVEKKVADWIEVNFMGVSYPDSRIWCNQISALAADAGSTVVAAAAAALLSADSRAYGGSQTSQSCMGFLQEAYQQHINGSSLDDIVSTVKQKNGKPIIVGFARPVDRDDERLAPYARTLEKFGLSVGPYLEFALKLSRYLDDRFQLSINSGGYSSAVLLDQGFTPEEGYKIKATAVVGGAIACFRNGEHLPPNSFLPQKCADIEYKGIKPRALP